MSKVKWVTGAAMLACTGALMACGTAGEADAVTAPSIAAGTTAPPSQSPASGPVSSQAGASVPSGKRQAASVLSGKRQVAIVRVQAFEGALALASVLLEVDGDEGRQLFVPTPLGEDRYLIKAYTRPNNHPAADEPSCWQVHKPKTTEPLTVQAAPCVAANQDQWFTITPKGGQTYAISHGSAFLQFSPTRGLILEELGDGPLRSTFRLVDNGPAPTVGG